MDGTWHGSLPELMNMSGHSSPVTLVWLRQEEEKMAVRLWASPLWPSEPQFPYL